MSGVTNLAAELSRAVMALGGDYAIAALGSRAFFSIGATMTAVGAAVFWVFLWKARARASR